MEKSDLIPYIENEVDDLLKQEKKIIVCFVEGKPDITFYSNFTNIFYTEYNVFFLNCRSLKNVIEIYEILAKKNWKKKKENNFLFFTDKDFSDLDTISERRVSANNIFITEFYSFENYIVNEQTVKRILIECLHDSNYIFHATKYTELYQKFIEAFKEINYLILYLRVLAKEKNVPPTISWKHQSVLNFLEHYFEINEKLEISVKSFQELINFEQIQREFKNLTVDVNQINFHYLETELHKRINNLHSMEAKKILNGHSEILFIKKYLEKVHKKIRAPHPDNYLTNEFLFILIASPRTETPANLKQFLETNYNILKETEIK